MSRDSSRQLFDLSLTGRRDRVALEWNGAEYTFGDIDERSNQMARALAERGTAPTKKSRA